MQAKHAQRDDGGFSPFSSGTARAAPQEQHKGIDSIPPTGVAVDLTVTRYEQAPSHRVMGLDNAARMAISSAAHPRAAYSAVALQ